MPPTPLCPTAQLIASTLSESPEAAFLLNTEGVVLYENPAGKRLIFETTQQSFDSSAADPKHAYHFSFFFSFACPASGLWQDYFDSILNDKCEKHTFDVNDTGVHKEYDVICKRTNGTEFPAALRLAKVGACPCCEDASYLCAYVNPKVAFDRHNNPFAKEESSLKCILNAAFDPVFSIDEAGTILMVNEMGVKEFGYSSAAELVGQNIKLICGGGHAKHHDEYIRNYLDTGVAKIIGKKREVPARRKDGSEFPVELGIKEVSCREYGMPAGKVVFVAFLKDLSAEKQHQLEMQDKVQLMQAMINSSFDPMFQIDEGGVIQNCNTAAVALFGYRREEMMNHNISMICGGEHAANHDQYLKNYLTSGIKKVIGRKRMVTARRKCGTEFDIELGVQEVASSTDGKKLFCGFVRDLTAQRMEKRRMRSVEENFKDSFFGGGNATGGAGTGRGERRKYNHGTTM